VAQSCFAGDGIKGPSPSCWRLSGRHGRAIDAGACSRMCEHAFLEPGPAKHTSAIAVFLSCLRENEDRRLTLVARYQSSGSACRAPRAGMAARVPRVLARRATFTRQAIDLSAGARARPNGKVAEILRKIAALPAGAPFTPDLELAPGKKPPLGRGHGHRI